MAKWQADKTPEHTLMIKYLKMIMKPAEIKVLIEKYVAIKQKTLADRTKKKCQ